LAAKTIPDPWRLLFPCLTVVATLALLILIEPDLGSVLVIGAVVIAMFFVAGLRLRHLGAIVLLAGAAATLAVIVEPFRWRRIVEYVLDLFGLAEPGYRSSSPGSRSAAAVCWGSDSDRGTNRRSSFPPPTRT